ncbi:MAG: hypothetical protein MUO85_10145 [candidate division Zixibacteria bacterium]|nr:hypothetical protein [candidate division Zixibacteria bacterium]
MGSNSHIIMGKGALVLLTSLFAVLVLAGTGNCKTREVSSYWTAEPIRVDGKRTDWSEDMPVNYFEEEGAVLALSNDSENLYILFCFKDPKWVRAIRMTGLKLWLDAKGKEKKDFGLRYNGGPSLSEMQAARRGGYSEDIPSEAKQRMMQGMTPRTIRFTFIDKKNNIEMEIPTDGSKGPAASFDTSMGLYSYEFSVPLQSGAAGYYGMDIKPGQTISIGAEWGDMGNLKGMSGPPGGMGGMPPGGMGGGPPGGRGGGGMGSGRESRGEGMQAPKKQEVWVKVKLALPPAEQQKAGVI